MIEGLFQVLLIAHHDHPPARFLGELPCDPLVAAVSGYQENMHDRVGALGGFDRVLQFQLAARVLGVRQDHQGLSPSFIGELVVGGEIDGVIEIRAAVAALREWTRVHDGSRRGVDLSPIDGAVQPAAVVAEIREQVHVQVKRDHHGQVSLAHDAAQEARGRFLLGGQHVGLAAAGVNQQAQCDGEVGVG